MTDLLKWSQKKKRSLWKEVESLHMKPKLGPTSSHPATLMRYLKLFKIDRSVTLFAITFSTCNWSSKFSNAESIGTKQIGTRTESSSIIVIGINYGENLY